MCVFKQEKASGGERKIGTDRDKETKKDRESDGETEKGETKIRMSKTRTRWGSYDRKRDNLTIGVVKKAVTRKTMLLVN